MDTGGMGLGHKRDKNQNWETYQKSRHPLSQSLSFLSLKHSISTFSYLFHCLPLWNSFPFFSVQKVGWHGLIQPVRGKWQLSPSTNFKFSGERLQWAKLRSVISPRSIHPGPWGRGNKLQMWLPDPPWDWEKFLEERAHRLGSNPWRWLQQ